MVGENDVDGDDDDDGVLLSPFLIFYSDEQSRAETTANIRALGCYSVSLIEFCQKTKVYDDLQRFEFPAVFSTVGWVIAETFGP